MKNKVFIIFFICLFSFPAVSFSEISAREGASVSRHSAYRTSIKTVNGKFYAYIVLLFNENPHFVNLIQQGTVSLKEIGKEGFNVRAFRNYMKTIQDTGLHRSASEILNIYLEPRSSSDYRLREIESELLNRNIVLKFFREKGYSGMPLTLDYCIFGRKTHVKIKHPLLEIKDDIYLINPFIYYDEFSTSNSTFYYDMIYINPDEVENDFEIAKNIIIKRDIKSMFFVGSKVNDDIRYCLNKSFDHPSQIKKEIWRMFIIHELTHKITNNQLHNFDQVTGEELSLSSTIYANPYLGMAVMYSYLNYGRQNPHRSAAVNYISYIAGHSGQKELLENPGLIKYMDPEKIRSLTKSHFFECIKNVKK